MTTIATRLRFTRILPFLMAALAVTDAFNPHIGTDNRLASPLASLESRRSSIKKITSICSASTNVENDLVASPLVQRYHETFEWRAYSINYRVEGPDEGIPILLIHGFGGTVNHFRFQFPALASAGYRVHAIDLIGFGGSDKPKDVSYSMELFTELCSDFIRAMPPKKPWVVCGNSIGGLCSLATAEQLDEKVQAVVLFNCAGGMSGFRYDDMPMLIRPILWFVQNVMLGPSFGGQFFENFKTRQNVESILRAQGVYRDTTNVDEELLEILLGPSDDEGAKDVFLKVFGGPPGPTPESILPNLKIPILALWGGADPWTPVDAGLHPGNKFGDYANGDFTLVTLSGAGHCPHDECPDQIHENMIPWLAANSK